VSVSVGHLPVGHLPGPDAGLDAAGEVVDVD